MNKERTLSIIKPDAVKRNIIGKINSMIEGAGFKIVAQKMLILARRDAESFYEVHKERPFFASLVEQMCEGPVVVQVLEKENAILDYRDLMGATDPSKALPGTIRKEHALNIGENSVHGSDSKENAEREVNFFFSRPEIVG
jgi:nucleoside-diphosphate kinase